MIDEAIAVLVRQNAGDSVKVQPSTQVRTAKITNSLPRIIYTLIDDKQDYTDDGADGLRYGHYQLDIFAASMTQARQIAWTVRQALDGYRGESEGVVIRRVFFPGENFARGERVDGANESIARVSQDLQVRYRQSNL